jgi:hypothetical protein
MTVSLNPKLACGCLFVSVHFLRTVDTDINRFLKGHIFQKVGNITVEACDVSFSFKNSLIVSDLLRKGGLHAILREVESEECGSEHGIEMKGHRKGSARGLHVGEHHKSNLMCGKRAKVAGASVKAWKGLNSRRPERTLHFWRRIATRLQLRLLREAPHAPEKPADRANR